MTTFHFRSAFHSELGSPIVEVWRDDVLIAVLYAHDTEADSFLNLTSKYLTGAAIDQRDPEAPCVIMALGRVPS